MHYVYILRSLRDKKLYIGCTIDLERRFEEHQKGEVVATKHRRPLERIFYEAYKNIKDAKRREKYFKTDKGKSMLRMMLRDTLLEE
jgi:putative endonuclease